MGAFLDKPKTEKTCDDGEANDGVRYGVSAMQGWRMEMEDAHVICTDIPELKNWSFFGVFDGHAGNKVSAFASQYLLDEIVKYLRIKDRSGEEVKQKKERSVEEVKEAMYNGFLNLDKRMRDLPIWANNEDHSGTTSVVALISPSHIIWGNCGDSRSILCSDSKLKFSTEDHKPANVTEKKRIEEAGGTVMMQRVNGTLAVSRALGDFDYKRDTNISQCAQLVSPEPDITVLERDEVHDHFLLLACDGVYDVMTNEEIVDYVSSRLKVENELSVICSNLIDRCLNKNSRDNMSAILVTFPAAPKYSSEAIEKYEKEKKDAEHQISTTLQNLVETACDPLELEENAVFDKLLNDKIDVYERKDFITNKLQELVRKKFGASTDNRNPPIEVKLPGAGMIISSTMTTRDDDNSLDSYDERLVESLGDVGSSNDEEMNNVTADTDDRMEVSSSQTTPTSPTT